MNRIERIFGDLQSRGQKALMPFITAGDPDIETTADLLPAIERGGGAICELGIPFSDPIADGPVIQASMTHALSKGTRPQHVLDIVRRQRARLNMGVVAMVSYTIVYRIGHPRKDSAEQWAFLKSAKDAGIDGFIIPDVTVEESQPVVEAMKALDLTCSFLISPSTSDERAERIARACTGFVYVLSRAGLTGEKTELPPDLPARIRRLRNVTDLPIAVGFGISNRQQVEQVTSVADAAIVGSAIMRRIAPMREQSREAVTSEVERFVRELAGR